MAVDVSFILHGKPCAGSHLATPNIDNGLCNNIVENFFREMSTRKDVAWLIADARSWQGQWYGVYTFWCGSNGVKDISNRESYIALSVVIRGHYCALVSDIYEHLKQVYETCIVGTYVQNGKYLVDNLSDPNAFNALCQHLSTGFPEAMKPFDNTFHPQTTLTDEVKYHIDDCDAKAFVSEWKQCGRIIVCTTATKKDSYRSEAKRLNNELEMSRKKHREKDEKLQKLNNEKTSLQTELNKTSQAKSDLVKEMDTLHRQVEALQASLKGATDALTEIAGIVTAFTQVTPPPEITSTESIWTKIKKSLDTFLLILILVGVGAFIYKAFLPDAAEQKEMTTMKQQIAEMHTTLSQLRLAAEEIQERIGSKGQEMDTNETTTDTNSTNTTSAASSVTNTKDVDCNISVTQGGKTISKSGGRVDFSQPIRITIQQRPEGYAIHTSNIYNEIQVKQKILNNQEVNISRSDQSKEVVIWYRRDDKNNANQSNRITLKQ